MGLSYLISQSGVYLSADASEYGWEKKAATDCARYSSTFDAVYQPGGSQSFVFGSSAVPCAGAPLAATRSLNSFTSAVSCAGDIDERTAWPDSCEATKPSE